eukprot:TRINITY_DN6504_c1_g4_i4.p1 TRINITY_DN6504_c1_g4~~TRINITY_DN6504_c1_g4_i4.p1  ORF type:complete len:203 (+),score=23.53 TRINITY_DN6504_c1_g4_i4:193-801(+)
MQGGEAKHAFENTKLPGKQDTMVLGGGNRMYECTGRSGKGSFGVVYKAVERSSNLVVAIKRVLQDPRYKNRELQIMKMIDHPNCVQLVNSFYERCEGEVYLNLVLGYIPKNLYEVCNQFSKKKEKMPVLHVKLYIYQLCRSLAYVHSLGICHRDIKPQNCSFFKNFSFLSFFPLPVLKKHFHRPPFPSQIAFLTHDIPTSKY